MDRRTILAFVLLTLVLILFQYFAPKPPHPAPAAQPAVGSAPQAAPAPEHEGASEAANPATPLPGVAGGPTAGSSFNNVLIPPGSPQPPLRIDAGTFRTEVQPRGGILTTWKLEQYTDNREKPADLVADTTQGLFRLRLALSGRSVDLSSTDFQISPTDGGATLLARDEAGSSVRIAYEFPRGQYTTSMHVRVDGFAAGDGGKQYLEIGFPAGINYVERDPKLETNAAAGVALLGERYVKYRVGRGAWEKEESGVVHWAGVRSKYFLLAAIPQGAPDGEVVVSHADGSKAIRTVLRIPLNLSGPTELALQIYGGPMKFQTLESLGVGLEKTVDLGWKIIVPFSRLLLWFFRAVHAVVPNYGVVILVLSVLTKVLFYPLTKKSMESMKQMQLLKPEMDRINEKFKDDPQRRNQATLELYKKYKVNPLGGCLPVLIQMPVFIALYNVLNSSIELRKAPFVLWIQDLSAPDRVGSVLGFPIHLLPLVMAATMIWQQKLTPTDPRQAAMAYIMPIFMTVFFYPLPSGLVFYWTVNNFMSIGQQMWMNRSMETLRAAA